jgi:hypothetical protein
VKMPKLQSEYVSRHSVPTDSFANLQSNDFDVTRAIDFIITGEFAKAKAAERNSSSSKGVLNTIKHYTRSKSPLKARKSSPATASNDVIDLNNEYDDDSEELRLALEMSLQESDPIRGRTSNAPTGQVSAETSPHFGPARDVDYNDGEWGVVLAPKEGQESGLVDDKGKAWSTDGNYEMEENKLSPEERKRGEGQPAVLDTKRSKGAWVSDDESALVGLMTILHKVQRVREAFLLASPRDPGNEDGPQDGWWNGGQAVANHPVEDGMDVTGECVLRETARIMAFLDDTERAYGK